MKTFTLTEAAYRDLVDENLGLCTACGAEVECCEPDARRYRCDACGDLAAYGAEELMLMGRIELRDDDGPDGAP